MSKTADPLPLPVDLEALPDEELRALGDMVLAEQLRRREPKPLTDEVPPWEEGPKGMDGIPSLDWAMMLETLRRDPESPV